MYLKQLAIFGFKSFADKTVFRFDAGTTCIVGPNGCGKSNIADAFRWVLGEQSAKSMRGGKMTDVIFSGTELRKALNIAEVSLTFADVGGALLTPYEEVTISRRLYRSGDSDYLLNGNPVRLKDLQDLFLGSGIGKNAFSIFEQGKLDQVIHDSPVDRRLIFEEAAGILRFLQRKTESLKRLDMADLNLSRVQDLRIEMGRQIETLKGQAEKATIFKEKKRDLDQLEKIKSAFRAQSAQKKQTETKENLKLAKKEWEEITLDLANKQKEYKEIKQLEIWRQAHLQSQKNWTLYLQSRKEIVERDLFSCKQRLQEIEQRISKNRGEELNLRLSIEEREKSLLEIKEKLEPAEKKEQEREKKWTEEQLTANIQEKTFLQIREKIETGQKEYIGCLQKNNQAQSELKQIEIRLENSNERALSLKNRLKSLTAELENSHQKKREKELSQTELSALVNERNVQLKECEENVKIWEQKEEEEKKKIESLNGKMIEMKTHHEVLVKVHKQNENTSLKGKRILEEANSPDSPFYQKIAPFYTCFQPEQNIEELIAVVLRTYSHTIIIERKDAMEAVLQLAEQKGSEHCSLENQGFIRQAEIEKLEKEIASAQKKLEESQSSLKQVREQKTELLQKKIELAKGLRSDEMKLAECNFAIKQTNGNEEKIRIDSVKLAEEIKTLLQMIEEQKKREEELGGQLSLAKIELQELQKQKDILSVELVKEENQLKKQKEELQKSAALLKQLSHEKEDLFHRYRLLQAKGQDDDTNKKRITLALEELKLAQTKALAEEQKIFTSLELLKNLGVESSFTCTEYEKKAYSLIEQCESIEVALQKKLDTVKQIEQTTLQCEIKLAEQVAVLASAERELLERFDINLEEAVKIPIPPHLSIDQMEKQIRSIKKLIEDVGDVNLAAIEDFEKEQHRLKILKAQIEDMEKSKLELLAIIEQLEEESRKLFAETFEAIRRNFQKNFAILFNGGNADLRYVDSEDILRAGIEIIVQPPGKQMRSMSLLSGGEKCLTAVALLFAIFEIKPSPFCILDEIDAPLDDTNVERFVNVVTHFAQKCQFIIITHNKRTMAIGDKLFGVSMEEKGVTKILSLAFIHEQEPEVLEVSS